MKNKRLNEQVKRNIKRFPDDFMFQLTDKEWNILKSQIATSKTPEDEAIALLRSQIATAKDLSKIRTLPYAFTRNGIGMLSSVLGSDTAVEMNQSGDYGIPVPDYIEENVSTKVVKIIQSYVGVVNKMVWRK